MEKKTGILIIILFVVICVLTIITNATKKYDRNVLPPTSATSAADESRATVSKSESEPTKTTSEMPQAIDPETASKVFIEAYYSIDSTQTGKFNPHAHYESYKDLLSGTAIENLVPLDNGNTEQSVSMSSAVTNLKTYSAKIVNDTATTLSLAQVHTTVKDISDSTDLHIVNLKFRFDGSQWLVDEVLLDQMFKTGGDLEKLFL